MEAPPDYYWNDVPPIAEFGCFPNDLHNAEHNLIGIEPEPGVGSSRILNRINDFEKRDVSAENCDYNSKKRLMETAATNAVHNPEVCDTSIDDARRKRKRSNEQQVLYPPPCANSGVVMHPAAADITSWSKEFEGGYGPKLPLESLHQEPRPTSAASTTATSDNSRGAPTYDGENQPSADWGYLTSIFQSSECRPTIFFPEESSDLYNDDFMYFQQGDSIFNIPPDKEASNIHFGALPPPRTEQEPEPYLNACTTTEEEEHWLVSRNAADQVVAEISKLDGLGLWPEENFGHQDCSSNVNNGEESESAKMSATNDDCQPPTTDRDSSLQCSDAADFKTVKFRKCSRDNDQITYRTAAGPSGHPSMGIGSSFAWSDVNNTFNGSINNAYWASWGKDSNHGVETPTNNDPARYNQFSMYSQSEQSPSSMGINMLNSAPCIIGGVALPGCANTAAPDNLKSEHNATQSFGAHLNDGAAVLSSQQQQALQRRLQFHLQKRHASSLARDQVLSGLSNNMVAAPSGFPAMPRNVMTPPIVPRGCGTFRMPRCPTARAAIISYPFPPVPVDHLPKLRHSHQQTLFDAYVKIERDAMRLQLGHFVVEHCIRSIPEEYLRTNHFAATDPYIIADFVEQIITAVQIFGEETRYSHSCREVIPTDINEVYISSWLHQKRELLEPLEILHQKRQCTSLRNGESDQTHNDDISTASGSTGDTTLPNEVGGSLGGGAVVGGKASGSQQRNPSSNARATTSSPTRRGGKSPQSSAYGSRRTVKSSTSTDLLGTELDSLGVPKMINCENLKAAIRHRGLVVQLPTSVAMASSSTMTSTPMSESFSSANSTYCCPSVPFGTNNGIANGAAAGTQRDDRVAKCFSRKRLLFNLLIPGRGDTRRSRMVLPWGAAVRIKYNRTLLGIPDFVVEYLGYGGMGAQHLIPKVCAVSMEDATSYGVEILLFYRGQPCSNRRTSTASCTGSGTGGLSGPVLTPSIAKDSNAARKGTASIAATNNSNSTVHETSSALSSTTVGSRSSTPASDPTLLDDATRGSRETGGSPHANTASTLSISRIDCNKDSNTSMNLQSTHSNINSVRGQRGGGTPRSQIGTSLPTGSRSSQVRARRSATSRTGSSHRRAPSMVSRAAAAASTSVPTAITFMGDRLRVAAERSSLHRINGAPLTPTEQLAAALIPPMAAVFGRETAFSPHTIPAPPPQGTVTIPYTASSNELILPNRIPVPASSPMLPVGTKLRHIQQQEGAPSHTNITPPSTTTAESPHLFMNFIPTDDFFGPQQNFALPQSKDSVSNISVLPPPQNDAGAAGMMCNDFTYSATANSSRVLDRSQTGDHYTGPSDNNLQPHSMSGFAHHTVTGRLLDEELDFRSSTLGVDVSGSTVISDMILQQCQLLQQQSTDENDGVVSATKIAAPGAHTYAHTAFIT